MAGAPDIVSPLVSYTPKPNTPYLDARPIMRAEPQLFGLAFDSTVFRRGIFQVDAVAPDQQGEPIGLRLAALVEKRFPVGTILWPAGYRLRIERPPYIARVIKDSAWVRYPVSIRYVVT